MTRTTLLAVFAVTLAGCASNPIPLYDKAGGTRDEEFHARVACIKQIPTIDIPHGSSLRHCMGASGFELIGYETP